MPPVHVISALGTTLDQPGKDRWARWRPNVDICQKPGLQVARLDLIFQERWRPLLDQVVADIRAVSPDTEVVCHPFEVRSVWDFEDVFGGLLDLLPEIPMDRCPEGPLVHLTTGSHVMQICWFLLTEARHVPGRILQTWPPREGQGQNWSVIDLDLSRYDRIARRFAVRRSEGTSLLKGGIDTRNAAFNQMIAEIEAVAAATREPILLGGPTGAGKTHLARRIWELKRSRNQVNGQLVEVNCATLRGDQAMSALFGHRRGAFTGALSDRPGLLVAAHGGVVFLDEVSELGLDEQAMLLRAVEERTFTPMGADQPVVSNFQLIAGSNVDLRGAVREGRFRDDLLARIDLWSFHLPGLAARPEDIEPNLDHELRRVMTEGGRPVTMNAEARDRFLTAATAPDASWNGNFRDLRAAVTRMATLAHAGRIDVGDVERELARLRSRWGTGVAPDPLRAVLGERVDTIDRFDLVQLTDVVAVCRASPSLAAAGRTLFAASRWQRASVNDGDRLRKYLARFGLEFAALRED